MTSFLKGKKPCPASVPFPEPEAGSSGFKIKVIEKGRQDTLLLCGNCD
jgi:hypothetical protein